MNFSSDFHRFVFAQVQNGLVAPRIAIAGLNSASVNDDTSRPEEETRIIQPAVDHVCCSYDLTMVRIQHGISVQKERHFS